MLTICQTICYYIIVQGGKIMNKEQKERRIKALYNERYFWEDFRHKIIDATILVEVNKYLKQLNDEYYALLFGK